MSECPGSRTDKRRHRSMAFHALDRFLGSSALLSWDAHARLNTICGNRRWTCVASLSLLLWLAAYWFWLGRQGGFSEYRYSRSTASHGPDCSQPKQARQTGSGKQSGITGGEFFQEIWGDEQLVVQGLDLPPSLSFTTRASALSRMMDPQTAGQGIVVSEHQVQPFYYYGRVFRKETTNEAMPEWMCAVPTLHTFLIYTS